MYSSIIYLNVIIFISSISYEFNYLSPNYFTQKKGRKGRKGRKEEKRRKGKGREGGKGEGKEWGCTINTVKRKKTTEEKAQHLALIHCGAVVM